MSHILNQVFNVSCQIDNDRSLQDGFVSLIKKVGELIEKTNNVKDPLNEAAEVIISVIDLLYLYNKKISPLDFDCAFSAKLDKWLAKSNQTGDCKDKPFPFERDIKDYFPAGPTNIKDGMDLDDLGRMMGMRIDKICPVRDCGNYLEGDEKICYKCEREKNSYEF